MEKDLSRENRIAFVLPTEFYEQDIESLQIDNADVKTATEGDVVGTITGLTKEQAKAGLRVYRVCES